MPHEPISELYVSPESAKKFKMEAADLPSWDLTPRQICDIELLMNGAFNPSPSVHDKKLNDRISFKY